MAEISETESVGAHIPIIHPEELERMLEDKDFADSIAAVTTTSIDVVRKLIADPTQSFKPYWKGYINFDVRDKIREELFGRKNKGSEVVGVDFIDHNVSNYGIAQAATGLLSEMGTPPEDIIKMFTEFDFGWFLEQTLDNHSDDEIASSLSSHKNIASHIKTVWPDDPEQASVAEYLIKEVFPEGSILSSYLKTLRGRQGVQVLMGDGDKFSKFARDSMFEPIAFGGVRIYRDIPRNLILGIVPRGKFEQQELLAV